MHSFCLWNLYIVLNPSHAPSSQGFQIWKVTKITLAWINCFDTNNFFWKWHKKCEICYSYCYQTDNNNQKVWKLILCLFSTGLEENRPARTHKSTRGKLSRIGKSRPDWGRPQLLTRSLTRVHFSRSLRKKNTSRKVLQVIKVLATFNFYNIKVTYFCWNLSLLKQML